MPDDNRIAVLLPAKNEALVIAGTLKSILAAGASSAHIYVVDDGSSDSTGEIAASFGANVLRNEVSIGKAEAVNRATRHFNLTERYDYIATLDADTLVDSGYFVAAESCFEKNPDAALVCGRVKSRPYNWLTAYRGLEYFMAHAIFRGGQSNMGVVNVAPGVASTYRSSAFSSLEWNDDTLVEDMDVTIQVHRKNLGAIVYEPGAVVHTQDPRTLWDYVRQIHRWYTGTWQVIRKYGMLKGIAKIDWEIKLLMGEGILFALALLLMPLWLALRPRLALVGAADAAIITALSLACALVEDRWDVLFYAPLYAALRVINCSVLLYSFWNTIVLGRHTHGWFSAARYQDNREETS